MHITTADSTQKLIAKFEGCELDAYLLGGIPHIGYGFTYYQSGYLKNKFGRSNVKIGDSIRQDEADAELEILVTNFAIYVDSLLVVEVSQKQFDSLVSLCYNIGKTAFKNSTLLRLLNKGDYSGAAAEFDKWVYAGGVINTALVSRRKEEKALFVGSGSSSTNYLLLAIAVFVVVKVLKN